MRRLLGDKGSAARRRAEQVRRRLQPIERALPVRLPGFAGAEQPAAAGAAQSVGGEVAAEAAQSAGASVAPAPADVAARIDAARERLRATIEPHAEADG